MLVAVAAQPDGRRSAGRRPAARRAWPPPPPALTPGRPAWALSSACPQQFLFLKQKCRSLFNQRKRPAKLAWTTLYRKQHRKVGRRRAW